MTDDVPAPQMTPEEHERAIDAIREKIPDDDPCPRCHQDAGLDIMSSYASFGLSATKRGAEDDIVNAVMTVCRNCGYVSFHMLNELGLLD